MWVSFENAAIHECAGISLVAVAEYIFAVAPGTSGKFPLAAGWKSRAPAPPQPGVFYFLDNLLRSHFRQRPHQRLIAVARNVIIYFFSVNNASVSERAQLLKPEKGDIIHARHGLLFGRISVHQPLHRPALQQMLFNKYRHVFRREPLIENTLRINNHDRSCGAEAVTASCHH